MPCYESPAQFREVVQDLHDDVYAWTRGALRTGKIDSEPDKPESAHPKLGMGFLLGKNGMRRKVLKGKRQMDLVKLIELMCGMMCMADLLEAEGRSV